MPSHFVPISIHSCSSKTNENSAPPRSHIEFDWTAADEDENQIFVVKFEGISLLVSFQKQNFWTRHEVEGIK